MKTKWMTLAVAASALAFSGAALAGDAAAGEGKAEMCLDSMIRARISLA